jgi:flagellar basal-body rod modification protein FlgD
VSTTQSKGLGAMDGLDFLKLLISELSNQDPFEPMQNKEILEQLSAIRSLESNMNMTQDFAELLGSFESLLSNSETMLNYDRFASATALIGSMVRGTDTEGAQIEGRVERVILDESGLRLQIGDREMTLGGVEQVYTEEGSGDGA